MIIGMDPKTQHRQLTVVSTIALLLLLCVIIINCGTYSMWSALCYVS